MNKQSKKSYNSYVAKIISCSYEGERNVRTDVKFPDHCQSIRDYGEVVELWETMISMEMRYDAGCKMDTYIVVSGVVGLDYLMQYDGYKTLNGTIRVLNRENRGGSFGAYDYAFRNIQAEYFLLTDDDIFIVGDKYAQKMIDRLNERNLGFVALHGITEGRHPTHANGAVGLTKSSILQEVMDICGKLPHHTDTVGWFRSHIIMDGEIPFTNEIVKLGYSMENYGNGWGEWSLIVPYYNYHELCM